MQTTITPLREPDLERSPQPPANVEAEQALLGAILINNAAHGRVAEFLLPEHFGNAVHGRIYAAISRLIERGQIANPVTLKNLFDQDGALQEIGGAQYLARLAESAVTIINAEHYGRTIHDLHLRRELITIGQDVVTDAFQHDLDDPAVEQIERAEQKLFELATAGEAEGGPQPFARALTSAITMAEAAFKRDGKTVGVATNFVDLDKKLGGLHPSDLIILAGRPSMGKTSLATNIAFGAAKAYRSTRGPDGRLIVEDGAVVGFFSLEMSAEQLATRILAEESGVSSDRIRRGEVRREDFDKFVAIKQGSDAVMFIFREEYYLSRAEPTHRPEETPEKFNDRYERWKERCEASYGLADVIIAKQRHGPIGTVKLHFEAETTKFDNFIGAEQLPAEL